MKSSKMLRLASFSLLSVIILGSLGSLASSQDNQYCSKSQPVSMDLLPEINSKLEDLEELVHTKLDDLKDQQAALLESFNNMQNTLHAILTKKDGPEAIPQETDVENYEKTIPPKFEQIGTRYFYIEDNQRLNWTDAAAACHRMGGYLAGIKNLKELYAIQLKLNDGFSYWLGINDLATKGKFISVASGKPAVTLKWGSIRPFNSRMCVLVQDVLMYDIDCDNHYRFICQADNEI
nr:accessory gland protein Acp29AB-like [Drosophila takahashii]